MRLMLRVSMLLMLLSISTTLAVSTPCGNMSESYAVFKGLVLDKNPSWARPECGRTYAAGGIAMLNRLNAKGVRSYGDEAFYITNPTGLGTVLAGFKSKRWRQLGQETLPSENGMVEVRYYSHTQHGQMAFGVMKATDGNTYFIFIRYR